MGLDWFWYSCMPLVSLSHKNVGALSDTIHSSGVPNLLSENISRSSACYIRYQNIMRLFSFHGMEFDSILHVHQEPLGMDQAQNLITAPFPLPSPSSTHTAPLDLAVSAPLPPCFPSPKLSHCGSPSYLYLLGFRSLMKPC